MDSVPDDVQFIFVTPSLLLQHSGVCQIHPKVTREPAPLFCLFPTKSSALLQSTRPSSTGYSA